MTCKHDKNFQANVDVTGHHRNGEAIYTASVRVCCAVCNMPFRIDGEFAANKDRTMVMLDIAPVKS